MVNMRVHVFVLFCFCFCFFQTLIKAKVIAHGFMFCYIWAYNTKLFVRGASLFRQAYQWEKSRMIFTAWPILCIQISTKSGGWLFYSTKIQAYIWIFNQNYFYYYLLIMVLEMLRSEKYTQTHKQYALYFSYVFLLYFTSSFVIYWINV